MQSGSQSLNQLQTRKPGMKMPGFSFCAHTNLPAGIFGVFTPYRPMAGHRYSPVIEFSPRMRTPKEKPMNTNKTLRTAAAIAIFAGALSTTAISALADNNSNSGGATGGGNGPRLKSGNYCTAGASAQVVANNNYTFVGIKGTHPDQRRVAGYARNGFSGEGFSIVPVSKKKIRIDQIQYGVSRTFKRC
jgi:hypothetical protein